MLAFSHEYLDIPITAFAFYRLADTLDWLHLFFSLSLSLSLSLSQVLKGSKKLSMSVRSVGRIPGGYITNHVYTWVDPQGRSVSPPPDLLAEHRSATLRRSNSQGRSHMQLLQDGDEKKVKAHIYSIP